jgi:hypothetical protein
MRHKTLARYSSSRLEKFLTELANLAEDHGARVRFIKKYGHMFSDLPDADQWRHPAIADSREQLEIKRAVYVQGELRGIWQSGSGEAKLPLGTRGARQWAALRFIRWAQESRVSFMLNLDVIAPGPFAQALLHVVNSERARVCRNLECRIQRYFFRPPGKKRQLYCSEICAEVAQRQWKKNWWGEHGVEWRKQRRTRAKKTQLTKTKGRTHGAQKTR